jgi:hypothetical protein
MLGAFSDDGLCFEGADAARAKASVGLELVTGRSMGNVDAVGMA